MLVFLIIPYSKKNMRELWPPQDEIDQMTGRSTFFVLNVLCFLYLFLGAYMYKTWEEDWTYLDAVYFIFVSTRQVTGWNFEEIGLPSAHLSHLSKMLITRFTIA